MSPFSESLGEFASAVGDGSKKGRAVAGLVSAFTGTYHCRLPAWSWTPSETSRLFANRVLVFFPSRDDLIANFLRVDRHTASGGNPQCRFAAWINSLSRWISPLRSLVLEKSLPNCLDQPHKTVPHQDIQNALSLGWQFT